MAVYIEFNAFIWAACSPKAPHVNLALLRSWCLEGMGHIETRGEATFAGHGVGSGRAALAGFVLDLD